MTRVTVDSGSSRENHAGDPAGCDEPHARGRKRRGRREAPPDPVTLLPFVRDLPAPKPDGLRRSFWSHDQAGLDYHEACIVGRGWAVLAIRHALGTSLPPVLGWAAMDMPRGGDACERGLQVGFLAGFAELAVVGAQAYGLDRYERFAAERDERVRRMGAGEGS